MHIPETRPVVFTSSGEEPFNSVCIPESTIRFLIAWTESFRPFPEMESAHPPYLKHIQADSHQERREAKHTVRRKKPVAYHLRAAKAVLEGRRPLRRNFPAQAKAELFMLDEETVSVAAKNHRQQALSSHARAQQLSMIYAQLFEYVRGGVAGDSGGRKLRLQGWVKRLSARASVLSRGDQVRDWEFLGFKATPQRVRIGARSIVRNLQKVCRDTPALSAAQEYYFPQEYAHGEGEQLLLPGILTGELPVILQLYQHILCTDQSEHEVVQYQVSLMELATAIRTFYKQRLYDGVLQKVLPLIEIVSADGTLIGKVSLSLGTNPSYMPVRAAQKLEYLLKNKLGIPDQAVMSVLSQANLNFYWLGKKLGTQEIHDHLAQLMIDHSKTTI